MTLIAKSFLERAPSDAESVCDRGFQPLKEPIPLGEQVWPDGVKPLVCTVTMTYNHEAFITDAIEGIINQRTTFPVWVCIHDDASSDRTADIVRDYQSRYPKLIKAFFQEINSHKNPNRKAMRTEFAGWCRAAKYRAFCEGDDYWISPEKLQLQAEYLEKNADVVMVGCYSRNLQPDGKFKKREAELIERRTNFCTYLANGGYGLGTLNLMVRNESVCSLRPLDAGYEMNQPNGDVRRVSTLLKHYGDAVQLPFIGGVYRSGLGIWGGLPGKDKRLKSFHNAKYVLSLCDSRKQKSQYWIRYMRTHLKSDIYRMRGSTLLRDCKVLAQIIAGTS